MIDTPAAFGPALFKALYKVQPMDFQVSEVLDIDLEGSGEHLYLHIEKTATNTDEVASLLEKACEVTSADIGVSGLKDRHAVTRQWFSVRTPLEKDVVVDALNRIQYCGHAANGIAGRGHQAGCCFNDASPLLQAVGSTG